ncbi:MAG: site-specific DNA-methyltransferase [Chitinophagales bacterium]
MQETYYKTDKGELLLGDSIELLGGKLNRYYKEKFQLIITSPPFPLNAKKKYGNLQGDEYRDWFASLAPLFESLLTDDGSIIIEIGNSWEANRPVQSLLHLESLLAFVKKSNLRLIQEFVCYNPSRLPSPAIWVTRKRIRTVDSYTHIWWIAKNDNPKADNRKILRPYSKGMQKLLERQNYNKGARPSGHNISKTGFLKDNGGSITHNLIEFEPIEENRENRLPYNITDFVSNQEKKNLPHNAISLSNTSSNDYFTKVCRERGIKRHPATMHPGLIAFFINFLTDEKDLILDPFAGSNTTGYVAEKLNRRWKAIEIMESYAKQSVIRFEEPELNSNIKLKPNE